MSRLLNNKILLDKLNFVYKEQGQNIFEGILELEKKYASAEVINPKWVDENDVILITYGDSIKRHDEFPLKTLKAFTNEKCQNALSAIHILPFYPFTSDDGFSVVDYLAVNEELGLWKDIKSLAKDNDLMFDAVINHISSESLWFKGYLKGEKKYLNYFIEADPELDYSKVVRPRSLPLLSEYETNRGTKYLWTTFSTDQIDINFESKNVFLEIVEVLINYARNGARYIRLDAIGFLWKELNSTCIHLEQTHEIIKIFRIILDEIVPGTILITETNVPHLENISYFGNGYDEAQMVYQFPLPPLTLHTFLAQSSRKILKWLESLDVTTDSTTYFNFLASHDGIGLRPIEGILTEKEKKNIVETVKNRGGRIGYRTLSDGTSSPYELNISYVDALTDIDESDELRAKKFLASQGILLSVAGVPGIYIHSLLGSRNYEKGVVESGINRRINREKLDYDTLTRELEENSLRKKIFFPYLDLINARKSSSAFSPTSIQKPVFINDKLFTIIRSNPETKEEVFVLINISEERANVELPYSGVDIITDEEKTCDLTVEPYEIMWIKRGGLCTR